MMSSFLILLLASLPPAVPSPVEGRAAESPAYSISWWSVDAGGATLSGGDFALRGSLGQPDVGSASGEGYRSSGGFWAVRGGSAVVIFEDDWESGDLSRWSAVSP